MLILLPEIVNVPVPRETFPPALPPPDRDPTDWLKPFKSKLAPATLAKRTTEFDEKALTAPPWKVPRLTVVVPRYVLFVPPRRNVPVPCIVNPPVPVMAPEYVVVILFPAMVNVPVPRAILPPEEPPPDKELIVWLKPFKSKPAPEVFAITMTELGNKALEIPSWRVPELIVVVPK